MPKSEPLKVPFSNISGKKLYGSARDKIIRSKELGGSEELKEFIKKMPASYKVSSIINASKKSDYDLSYKNKERLKKAVIEHFSKAYREDVAKKIKERNVRRSIYEREETQKSGVSGGTGMLGGAQNVQTGFVGQKQGGSASVMSTRFSGEKRISRASVGGKTQLGSIGSQGPSGPMKPPSLNKPSLKF